MKITREDYLTAKTKLTKLKERMVASQGTVKQWEDAEKTYGKPEGYEVVAFIIDNGTVDAITRRIEAKEPKK